MSTVNPEPLHVVPAPEATHPPSPAPGAPPPLGLGTKLFGGVAMVGAVVGLTWATLAPRQARAQRLDALDRSARAPKRLPVATLAAAPAAQTLSLPGTLAPLAVAQVNARTTAFVRRYLVDLGDAVRSGQLMAELEAPEAYEELAVARARLAESERNVALVKATSERQSRLASEGVASKQAADDARLQLNAMESSITRNQAEVKRLEALTGYLRIVAPFDGVVTRRNVEVGTLVSPSAPGGLFELARTAEMKLVVDVPQTQAAWVEIGQVVKVKGRSGPEVEAQVTRSSGSLDAATRTLRVEAKLPKGAPLLVGSYVTATFPLVRPQPPVLVPASALSIRKDGPQVIQVLDGKAHVVNVKIGWDRGRDVEVLDGIAPGAVVVLNPPDTLVEGDAVEPLEAAKRGA